MAVQALVRLESQRVRDQRRRTARLQVVELRACLPADREHVAEALRRDQRRARPFALEHRVRRHSRTVDDLIRREARLIQPGQHASRRVVWCRGPLVDGQLAVLPEQEVGECPADVDSEDGCHDEVSIRVCDLRAPDRRSGLRWGAFVKEADDGVLEALVRHYRQVFPVRDL